MQIANWKAISWVPIKGVVNIQVAGGASKAFHRHELRAKTLDTTWIRPQIAQPLSHTAVINHDYNKDKKG